jgi:hemin uptake protein HemP
VSNQDHASFKDVLKAPCPVHNARVLTQERGEAKIILDDKVYTLRITRQGKLILTK